MISYVRSAMARFHKDRRGSTQSVEVIMMIAICMMVCLGITQVAGIGMGGAEDSGMFGSIGGLLDNLDLGGVLPF